MNQLTYQVISAMRINDRGLGKPNEDFVLIDRENQIFILLDGITRVHQEYTDAPGKSAALDVSQLFAETAHAYIIAHLDEGTTDQLLHDAAVAGNKALLPYRSHRPLEQWQFYPGTLGILAMIRDGRLYFLYVGDCLGTLIRQGAKLHFAQQAQNEALEKMKISKADRYNIYCNHPEHPLGYGIFNGDESAEALFQQSSLELLPGDTLILCTDGLRDYIRCTRSRVLTGQTAEQMIASSAPFDAPPFASYADDKAVIKLTFD